MPSFDKLFATTVGPDCVEYNGKKLIRIDYLPFKDGQRFKFAFQKKNSSWRQGVFLYAFGHLEVEGKKWKDRVLFWEDTAPKEIVVTVYSSKGKQPKGLPPSGTLGIKNIWDCGSGRVDSWGGGAAMIVEEIPNGRRYLCNDGHPDENFDDIVFTVQWIEA